MTKKEKDIKKIAMLVALASVVQIAENLLPSPLPGVKLGLANIITLVVLSDMGFKAAFEVAVLRTIISSLILGTFLSPTFILSLSGAVVSTAVMGLLMNVFGFIGLSVIGSASHVAVQVVLVYLLLIKNTAIFLLLPWLGVSAVIMGWFTGIIAMKVCEKLEKGEIVKIEGVKEQETSPLASKTYIEADSAVHSFPVTAKISIALTMIFAVLIFSNIYFYIGLFALLLILGSLSKLGYKKIFSGVKRLRVFLVFSFILPVLFGNSGQSVFEAGFLRITAEGLFNGVIFSSRLVLLMLATTLVMSTTSPEKLSGCLKKYIGKRLSEIVTLSMLYVPGFWEKSNNYIKGHKVDTKIAGKLFPIAVSLLVMLYMETEKI